MPSSSASSGSESSNSDSSASSTSSLSTEDDIAVQDLYVENGRLFYMQYGVENAVRIMDMIPVYERLHDGCFSAPSLRDVAHMELEEITRKLMNLGVTFRGEKGCANHTGMFSGSTEVNAGHGVLVRVTEPKRIRGRIGGSDNHYRGCAVVRSKPTDGRTTLQPDVNYIIHGDDSDDSDDSHDCHDSDDSDSGDWVTILRDKNTFSQLTQLEAPVDVRAGYQLMFVDGKYKRQIPKGSIVNFGTSTRVRVVDVPEDWETMRVTYSDMFTNYSFSTMVVKAIKLCNRLRQPLEISKIANISRQRIEVVIAVIARCSSHLVGDIAVNGSILGIKKGDGATNFKKLPEVSFNELRWTMVRLHRSDGLYIHRTMGAIEVQGEGEIRYIESGSGARAPYEGKVKWAG